MAMGKSGKKAKIENAEELDRIVDGYFKHCKETGQLPGEAGLALACGVASVTTIRNWYDGETRPELQESISRAYLRLMNDIETNPIYREKGGMTSMAIFKLKQSRFGGYQDRVESKQDLSVNVQMGKNTDESDFK